MTREEIILMAHEVGILMRSHEHQVEPTKLERFAELVAAAERKACEKLVWATPEPDDVAISHREAIVKAIRARGKE